MAMLPDDHLAVLLEALPSNGVLTGSELVVIRRRDMGPISHHTTLEYPENEFVYALNPSINFSVEHMGLQGNTPYGTFTLADLPDGAVEVRLIRPDGTMLLGSTIPQELVASGSLVIGPEAQRVVWFNDRQVRLFDREGLALPELLLPRPATSVRLVGRGLDLLVADGSYLTSLWTHGETGWSQSSAYVSDRNVKAVDVEPTGRWLLATVEKDSFDYVLLIDRETGTPVKTLFVYQEDMVSGWFWDAETIAISHYSWVELFRLPSLADYRRLAVDALRPTCRTESSAEWHTSSCWRDLL
jgi:hypothetical protein